MKYNRLRPILWTNQLIETIDFYTKILGFAVAEQHEAWGWASLYKDEVEIMLAKPNEHIPFDKPIFTGSFYINTDKVDELWEELKNKVEVCYEIEDFEWQMREFAIYDNNGYLIQFGQDISEKM
ncbi:MULTISPECIES: VOC family protein [unclassified Arcicella]|uniref:VOC family protein n=1 Tax=unclassified Arcicella TaxID=2644986 RepID=UPI0028542439|nr:MULTISPECIES: VOC family protein [unclassified Arcicella]MDR6561013.1 putative glyoxalase superfamily protein PhnB [Arcicella sp. BE51]MDR6810897.1 putative glyoxalase superfamily protein PhnB [Arcicella sp. BE140]MDR6822247.1 putative glyoxalase superfamily protein PhnB [Arcicella sp. BE139]